MLKHLFSILAKTLLFLTVSAGLLDPASTQINKDDPQAKVLTAIKVRPELERRSTNFLLKSTLDDHYVDQVSLLESGSARFAKTSMMLKSPALSLEDIETYLEEITCLSASITLKFLHKQDLRQARKQWDQLSRFIIISSHPSCNGDGERAPYIISKAAYRTDEITVEFSAARVDWTAAYTSMKVDFGISDAGSSGYYSVSNLRSHERLRRRLGKRQATASPTVTYPSAPTSTPTIKSSIKDITFFNNSASIISFGGVTAGCRNCSMGGTIEITQGVFTVNSSSNNEFEAAYHFIENGFFKVVAHGVSARMELDTLASITPGLSFSPTLATVALPGFQIPDIAAVGPQLVAYLLGSIEVATDVKFTYGFDLTVPDGSFINFNIANLTNSSSHGFSQSTVTATPFSATVEDISLNLNLGLRAEVLLGVNILSGAGNIEAGLFLDLPALSVSISPLSGVNAHCEPLTSSSAVDGFLSHIFPNLTHIVSSANISIGLQAGANLRVPAILASRISEVSMDSSTALLGTGFALETACLSWDRKATKFVEPTFSSTTTSDTSGPTATASETGGKKNLGSPSRGQNPLAWGTGEFWAAVVGLGCIIALPVL